MGGKAIHTDRAPGAIGPYSQAISAGGWLFVSGQIGLKPDTGELASGDFGEQSRQSLENLRNIVESVGLGLTDIVSVDVFITDIGRFAEFNAIYGKFFSGHKPARAVIEVKGLPKGALVEVKCVAFSGS